MVLIGGVEGAKVELVNDIAWSENKRLVGRRVELMVSEGEGRKDAATHRLSGRGPDNRLVHFTAGASTGSTTGPPRPGDMEEAEAVCRELGLGELLDRMPAGLLQMVGESGWQLSHGEKSRLYIARALLQRAELIVLDESFAALDPESLRRALGCVLERARTLLVIAHP